MAHRSFAPITVALVLVLATPAAAAPPTASSRYTVRRGDTLHGIAARFGTTAHQLAAANGLRSPDRLAPGQKLTVPVATSATGLSGRYRVRRGDTLAGIASRLGTSVSQLERVNGISRSNSLREGAFLLVPVANPRPACPVRGAIDADFADGFGSPRHGRRTHSGNDIFARRGTRVVAPMSGRLRPVRGRVTGIGFYLDGDDGVTYYGAHLDRLTAAAGRVRRGDALGAVGSTGNARGLAPHLHFEVKPGNGAPVDPFRRLRSWC